MSAAWTEHVGGENEVLVLCQLPELENSLLCSQATNFTIEGLEDARPRLVIDDLYHFSGTHESAMGTNLFFSAGDTSNVSGGADGFDDGRAELLGQSTHLVRFKVDQTRVNIGEALPHRQQVQGSTTGAPTTIDDSGAAAGSSTCSGGARGTSVAPALHAESDSDPPIKHRTRGKLKSLGLLRRPRTGAAAAEVARSMAAMAPGSPPRSELRRLRRLSSVNAELRPQRRLNKKTSDNDAV